jgi:hypothetical protein
MDKRDPDFEDRERLERLLKWREATGRHRGARDRRVLFLCVGTVLGVLTGLVAGPLVRTSFDKPAPLAADQTRQPAKQLISPSRNGASESARRGDVGASVAAEPSRSVEKVQTAAVEAKAEEYRSPVKPRRSARLEPRTSRPPKRAVAAPELPERSPSSASALPRLGENPTDVGPSFHVRAFPLPPRPIPAPLEQPQMLSESPAAAAPSTASSPTVVRPEVPSVLAPDLPKEVTATEVTATKDVAAAGAPFPPQPVPATLGAGNTPHETAFATSLPPVAVVTPALPPVPRADIAKSQRPGTMETVKRLLGYIPEVRAGKAIYRWVKSQPPADPGARPSTPSPQTR